LYSGQPGGGLTGLLEMATMMIDMGDVSGMVAVKADAREAVAVVLGRICS